ncbi:MAG: biotin/lipoyl-binding protein [Chloroflexota bacterium]|nr:biotin/lipoyl-binding protein [Chloroflexota bacterium]
MFDAVLVANRGEIAVRIIGTLRTLGVRAVLVASVPDRRSLAARLADEVVLLEGHTAADTYLDVDAVIAAAKATGCEAVHPGYGLLSERPDFARACADAGLVFVGPSPETLTLLGDKVAARDLAVANDVPVAPGAEGATDAELAEAAREVGFPLMLKARGGGGGLGMRVVSDPDDLAPAIEAARRQTSAAFGDDRLFVERYVENAHHVEVQVLADAHGSAVHLGERDCSVQRRHQKLVEETPSPVVDDTLRAEITGAALTLMRAAGYVNAGTVEFLVGEPEDGRRPFYFLEVNPRLQVEHPVTEAVTGLDLVALQLAIATGDPLPFAQDDVRFDGHAIEFRLNAEDPWAGFLPAAGRLTALTTPGARLDTGYEAGDAVPSEYDSLVAKLVVRGPARTETLGLAAGVLGRASVDGLRTNLPLHRAVVADSAFAAGEASVQWLERELPALLAAARPSPAALAAAATLLVSREEPGFLGSAWLAPGARTLWLDDGAGPRAVSIAGDAATVEGEPVDAAALAAATATLEDDGAVVVETPAGDVRLRLVAPPAVSAAARAGEGPAGEIRAPLAGRVAAVDVREGDAVGDGDVVAVLDAMKMEHAITAPGAGTVRTVHVAPDEVVEAGALLVELE